MRLVQRGLTDERIEKISDAAALAARNDDRRAARKVAQPLVAAQKHQPKAARALARLIDAGFFERNDGMKLAATLFEHHPEDILVLGALGGAFESLHDIGFLNAAPPSEAFFREVAERLSLLVARTNDRNDVLVGLNGLATAARVLGRTWDAVAERSYRKLVELEPTSLLHHYGLGLFYKTRGRFREGQAANQRAFDLGGEDREGVLWNLGICATGARDGQTALRIWKHIGQKIEMGRFALPEGRYPGVKVRLAERPIALRHPGVADDPGDEETIWVERLSPCHGIVRSALYSDAIETDFGDVVLFDGAPITHHRYDDESVPVFPQLTTLERPGYRVFRFAGTQKHEGQLAVLSDHLPEDAVVYSHTEQFVLLCTSCWNDPDLDHASHRSVGQHIVRGKICAPPTLSPRELLTALDAAVGNSPGAQVFAPELAAAAGQRKRANVERRRCAMIETSRD